MTIGVIGATGNVGSMIVYHILVRQMRVDRLVLFGRDGEKIALYTAQMEQVIAGLDYDYRVQVQGRTDIADSDDIDVMLFVAGASLYSMHTDDRDQLLETNKKILCQTINSVSKPADKTWIIVTNPVDQLVETAVGEWLDRMRVMGVSTYTDTVRMWNCFPKSFHSMVFGRHDGRMQSFPVPHDMDQVEEDWLKLVHGLGGTWFVTSTVVASFLSGLMSHRQELLPVSVVLDGEFGIKGQAMSVPCVVGRGGIEMIVDDEGRYPGLAAYLQSLATQTPEVE